MIIDQSVSPGQSPQRASLFSSDSQLCQVSNKNWQREIWCMNKATCVHICLCLSHIRVPYTFGIPYLLLLWALWKARTRQPNQAPWRLPSLSVNVWIEQHINMQCQMQNWTKWLGNTLLLAAFCLLPHVRHPCENRPTLLPSPTLQKCFISCLCLSAPH